ncbi:MAG: penicillin-binding protein 1A [Gammaproteobacteria bacterium]|nr:penicillin-binding protein 1A [Gammaproteobacteria bacterium]
MKKLLSVPVLITVLSAGFIAVGVMALAIYLFVVPKLPPIENLRDIQFQVPLKIYSKDEKLIAEYGEKKRVPLDIEHTPQLLINAVLAAEDDRFFQHHGVDYRGLLRAVVYLLRTGQKGQGGSTITMQVARNFFLSREKTYLRKLNEILLALKIEREISKNEILELYLNKIYLGNRSYGFAAAAQVYYGKRLEEMTPAEIAMIAGLPKAPSRYNPIVNPDRALLRRNYVLSRMRTLGKLSEEQYQEAKNSIDTSRFHGLRREVSAPYIAEMVRAALIERLGKETYTSGYKVYTTIDSRLQLAANKALRDALMAYTERHGFRGAEANVDLAQTDENDESSYRAILSDYQSINGLWPALVISVGEKDALVYQSRHGKLVLDWQGMKWAAPWRGDGKMPGKRPKKAADILRVGDIIRITQTTKTKVQQDSINTVSWALAQVPHVEGALVSLSAHDGSVLALVGGFDFNKSSFNRVTQALRQPGSNIKPFNYSAALEKGYTAASLINDAPIVFDDPGLESTWRPENYSGKVFGPTRLRQALIKSRNLVSIRLLRSIGISYAIDYITRFGFKAKHLPRDLSLSLGSASITPMELVTAYAVFANGGYKIDSYFIDRIENSDNVVIMTSNPLVVCEVCENYPEETAVGMETERLNDVTGLTKVDHVPEITSMLVPVNISETPDAMYLANIEHSESLLPQRRAKRIITSQNAYIMNSILRDVVKLGTGRRALQLKRSDLAGKTGTTNDQRDAWFSGYNPDIVTTAWVGFDTPQPLGSRETGGRAALPMWISYMAEALQGLPDQALERPPGLVSVRIDPESGLLVSAGFQGALFETFRADNVPKSMTDEDTGMSNVMSTDGGFAAPDEIPEQLF